MFSESLLFYDKFTSLNLQLVRAVRFVQLVEIDPDTQTTVESGETGIRSNRIRSNRQIGMRSNGIRSEGNHLENKI